MSNLKSFFGLDPPADGFVRACPEFNSGMAATISVILNLIQNQLDPDFRQNDHLPFLITHYPLRVTSYELFPPNAGKIMLY